MAPILWEPHYAALDQRLKQIINSINQCIRHYGVEAVVLDEPDLDKIYYVDESKFNP